MNRNFLQLFSQEADASTPDEAIDAGDTAAEFDSLIKGRYRDEYHRRVQSVIDKRFSKMKAMEGTLQSYAPLMERLSREFPHVEKSDTEGLISAFLASPVSHTAAENNNTVAPAFIEALEGRMKMKAAEAVRSDILRDAEALREIYPAFDLHRELSSTPVMKSLILSGLPLRTAYEASHLEAVVGSAISWAMMKASRDTAQQLLNSGRVTENSLSHTAAATRHKNVNSLTEKDIREILTAVGNGEKVVF